MPRPIPTLDRLGRIQHEPHRLMHGIEGALWLAERIPPIRVPSSFWSLDADPEDAGSHVAVVACPCGGSPVVRLLAPLLECGCGRWFFFESRDVWVFKAPDEDAEKPDDATVDVA